MSGSALSFHTSEAPCPISCIEAMDQKVETLPLIAYAVFWEGLLLIMFCVFAHVHTFMDVSLGVSLSRYVNVSGIAVRVPLTQTPVCSHSQGNLHPVLFLLF